MKTLPSLRALFFYATMAASWLSLLCILLLHVESGTPLFIVCSILLLVFVTVAVVQVKLRPPSATRPLVAGDVVRLKSGGQLMTVEWHSTCTGWWCVWFDPQGVRQIACFQPELLQLA